MTLATRPFAPGGTARPAQEAVGPGRRQTLITLGLLAAVILLDQATKWWGWRHSPYAFINSGGTWIIGRPVSAWFSGPVSGPLLDRLDVGLLTLAGIGLVRRRRRAPVLAAGALMLGGWSSNLLDRLGMHTLTAPGSVRGAVDFIRLGPPSWNLADFFIVGATVLFLVTGYPRGRRRGRAATAMRPPAPMPRPRAWAPRRTWVAAVGTVVAVVLSVPAAVQAGSDDGVDSSRQSSAAPTSHV